MNSDRKLFCAYKRNEVINIAITDLLMNKDTKDIDGTPVPESMIQWMNSDRKLFCAYKRNEVINIAITDLLMNKDTKVTTEEIMKQNGKVNDSYMPNTHWVTGVHHFSSYAGMYYTYPLGAYFAEKLWTKYGEDREALGDQLRSKFLSVGGVKNGNKMMEDLFEEEIALEFTPGFSTNYLEGHLPSF